MSVDVRSKPRIWKISIDGTSSREAKSYCLKHGEARIGWGNTGDLKALDESTNSYYQSLGSNDRSTLRSFAQEIVIGDILVCIRSAEQIEAVGVVTSDYRFEEPDAIPVMVRSHYNHVRSVKWLYHDVGLSILPLNDDTRFTLKTVYPLDRFSWGDLLMYLQENGQQPVVTTQSTLKKQPYVLVIDEINRGNVSRIFGELITLIEPSKRAGADEALTATLPYSKRPFSVPDNLYLIGTMNTADRSLAGLDIALRRRFEFCEMPPRPELLDAVEVQGLNIGKLLRTLNQRIEVLLDRDHCLGHAYFMPLKKDCSLSRLELIFRNQILPLLQEYFFEDWQRIQWVLNDHRKPALDRFVEQDKQDVAALFGNISVPAQGAVWRINDKAFKRLSAYAGVIAANAKTEEPAEEPGEASA
ncbi:AAA domain-containing protein [Aeromonas sp. 2MA4]|nr:AAA domain-containing protein [Aeromonas sp. 2MA4]